jgi:hypothetical protein
VFNFGGITHVISNPAGHKPGWNYSLVGSVYSLMLQPDGRGKQWPTVQSILDEAGKHAGTVKMCDIPTCACRKLFKLVLSFECSYTKGQLRQILKSANCLMPERLPRVNDKEPASWSTATGYIRVRRDPHSYSHKMPMYIYSILRWEVAFDESKEVA